MVQFKFMTRNIMVQYKFNLDAQLIVIIFLVLNLHAYRWCHLRCLLLYACVESLSYLADNMHAPNFYSWCSAMYYYLFVKFNILFTKGYAFIRGSPYVCALLEKCLKIKILQIQSSVALFWRSWHKKHDTAIGI